ncbi:cysteine desulfurase family protein [Dyadobacter sp. LHD-138]|uniref:cysteine desulfurase family protein n=1 Tax=Dyadobacter sp. LHD-138 TaxID=3071413 RepID=UPI0027DEB615|nr:cysteine desulfurase family protein [Dyadobacter sp. LHD-138]MDQ6478926.1 cysteine desulfurase family protein [Dyadobacter sp. LHD-138]
MEIYCDSAATTAIDPEVIEAILPYLTTNFGNPSSSHWAGRKVREVIDAARQTVARLLSVTPEEIFFVSGATEANNLALSESIREYGLTHAITSRIEHKAVLEPLLRHEREGDIEISYVKLDKKGNVDLEHLERLLDANPQSLISLMHGNNEIGNLTDIQAISKLAKKYNAAFHTDTTQTIGKVQLNLSEYPVDFLVGSAHKFHGPKGVGFIYINKRHKLKPRILGGGQEGGQRGGTENVIGIAGLAKALEIAYRDFDAVQEKTSALKQRLIAQLENSGIENIGFNGESRSEVKSLGAIANVSFPCLKSGSLVNSLDQLGIAVSGGSACSNLGNGGSHVIRAIEHEADKENVRFSFSKFNTSEEVDQMVSTILRIYQSDVTLSGAGILKESFA